MSSQWYLMLLSVDQDRLTLPWYPNGTVTFLRGYYIIQAQRDGEGHLFNCLPQSERILDQAEALATFQSMQPNGI